jgi:hypothetical protein
MRLTLITTLFLVGCSDGQRRDATEAEVRAAAAKCDAPVIRMGRNVERKRSGPSDRELGIPSIFVKINSKNAADFESKASCIDQELNVANAYSNIYGPNGEDLLVSSGVDRIF